MLNWLVPDANQIARNPIFWIEERRIPKRDFAHLIAFSMRWILRVVVIVIGLWMLYDFFVLRPLLSPYSYSFITAVWENYAVFFLATIGAGILLDLASVLVSVNSIAGDKLSGRWDYILMADMPPLNTIRAKHSVAQLRAWRSMIILIGLRIAGVVVALIHLFILTPLVEQISFTEMINNFLEAFSESSFEMISLIIVLITYIIEPLWRMRTVTAFSIAFSARGWRFTMTLLACFAGIAGMWISQAMLTGLIIWLTTQLLPDYIGYTFFWRMFFMFYVFGFACVIYFYYRITRNWSLRRAAATAFRT